MAKRIVGGVAGVPNPYSDWNQTDPNKADYIKNKPNLEEKADKSHVDALEETILRNESDIFDLQNDKADKTYVQNMYADLEFLIYDKIENIDITTDDKLSTTSTNPVQNKVIAAELNKKADKALAFDGVIELQGNPLEGNELNQFFHRGIYKVLYSVGSHNVVGILEVGDDSYIAEDYEEYWETQKFTNYNNECYQRTAYPDTPDSWTEWEKVSVSQTDLSTAIGDIETSLDNIIKKYGLGGGNV